MFLSKNKIQLQRAVFFDRDDTLIENVPYNGDPEKVKLIVGARDALEALQHAGFLLFVVSNQSGVARGLITAEDVERVNQRMLELLGKNFFQAIYNSYALPNDPKDVTRKPSPYFLKLAADEYSLDLSHSWLIGDRAADVECAKNAGCRAVLLPSDQDDPAERKRAERKTDLKAGSILEAAQWVLREADQN